MDTLARLIQSDRFEEAYELCLPLAEADDAEAQMYVGWMHHVGKGVEKNLEEAERWYRRALAAQSPRVDFFLASICWEKDQRDKKNEWLEKAASKGFPPALYDLGLFAGESDEALERFAHETVHITRTQDGEPRTD